MKPAMLTLLRCAALSCALLPVSVAWAASCDELTMEEQKLAVLSGMQELLNTPDAIKRIAVGNPETADVTLISPRSLLVQGKKSGQTSLMVWLACAKEPVRYVVDVPMPPAPPSATDQLKRGEPLTDDELAALPAQVQVGIRFVEISRTRLREMGVSIERITQSVEVSSMASLANPFSALLRSSGGNVSVAIDLMEQAGYAYTLSQPTLTALSGQSAVFLAGGEIPIPVPGSNGTVTIEYKEFGVRLSITPTVLSRTQLSLKVAPEVSELDFNNSITLNNVVVPGLRVRRTDTSLSMADGESFVISGLVSKSMRDNVDRLPGLGQIPIIGALFRSTSLETEDRELLMIVTPRLVQPMAANAKLPDMPGKAWENYEPDTAPLFFEGIQSPYGDAPVGFWR